MLPLSAALATPSLVRRRNVDLENLENLKEGIRRANEGLDGIPAFPFDHPIKQAAERALESLVLDNQVNAIEEAVRKHRKPPVLEYVDNPH